MVIGETASSGSIHKNLLNRDDALDRVGNDPQMLISLMDVFLEGLPTILDAIRKAMKTKDAIGVGHAAHRLRGSVSLFGAEAMADVAFALERAGRNGDLTSAGQRLAELDQEIARLRPALAEFRQQLAAIGGA